MGAKRHGWVSESLRASWRDLHPLRGITRDEKMEPEKTWERVLLAVYKHRIAPSPAAAIARDLGLSYNRVYKTLINCKLRGEVKAKRVGPAKRNIEWEILRQGWKTLRRRGLIQ